MDEVEPMDAFASSELELDDEPTVSMPVEVLPLRSLGLVEPLEEFHHVHYEPPVGRLLKRYFAECRQRARELREYERTQYADTLYQRGRRLVASLWAHMKKNATQRPWEDYEKKFYCIEE